MKLLGKACSLEETIQKFTNILKERNIEIVVSKTKNPVKGVWSVNIASKLSPECYVNGKGVSEDAAIASALGEFFERYSQDYFFADYALEEATCNFNCSSDEVLVSSIDDTLNDDLRELYYDEDSNDVVMDFNSNSTEIVCLPFFDATNNNQVLFPINVLTNLYGSNGMAAGNTLEEAKVQALSEIVERYVKFKIISDGISLPDVPDDILAKFPNIIEAKKGLEKSGHKILIKDASLGGKFPVVNVTLFNPKDGGVFANFGAHPKFQVALERTMTELCQGRDIDSFNGLKRPSWNSDVFADPINLEEHFVDSAGVMPWQYFTGPPKFKFWPWNTSGEISDELDWMEEIIRREGFNIYYYPNSKLGVETIRTIIPGMSEVYPFDDLAFNNCNKGRWIRSSVLNLHHLSDDECSQLVDEIENIQSSPKQKVAALIGLLGDENCHWKELSVGELVLSVLIKIKDYDRYMEYSEFLAMTDELPLFFERLRVYITNAEVALSLFGPDETSLFEAYLENPFRNFVDLKGSARTIRAHHNLLRFFELGIIND